MPCEHVLSRHRVLSVNDCAGMRAEDTPRSECLAMATRRPAVTPVSLQGRRWDGEGAITLAGTPPIHRPRPAGCGIATD